MEQTISILITKYKKIYKNIPPLTLCVLLVHMEAMLAPGAECIPHEVAAEGPPAPPCKGEAVECLVLPPPTPLPVQSRYCHVKILYLFHCFMLNSLCLEILINRIIDMKNGVENLTIDNPCLYSTAHYQKHRAHLPHGDDYSVDFVVG